MVNTFLENATARHNKWKCSNQTNQLFKQYLFLSEEEQLLKLQLLESKLLESQLLNICGSKKTSVAFKSWTFAAV
jgi:hypothetical protein